MEVRAYDNIEIGKFSRNLLFLLLLETDDWDKWLRIYRLLTYQFGMASRNRVDGLYARNNSFGERKK